MATRGRTGGSARGNAVRARAAEFSLDSDAFMASLRAALAGIEVAAEEALWRLALGIQNYARLLAPVDTGRLRSSIFARRGDGYVEVGSSVNYAVYVEFGTRFSPAQPYLRPAILIGAQDWGQR